MDRTRKGLIAALLVGLISGPAVALAASGAFSGGSEAEAVAVAMTAPVVTTTVAGPGEHMDDEFDAAEDLRIACTVDGPDLVAAEHGGTITGVERAALDALREICAASGLVLGGPPEIEEIVEQVVVRTVTVSSGGSGDDDYDDYDDAYEDDDDHDEEYEDEEEYEDDEEEEDEEDEEDDEPEDGR
jgi:hypothetical protein